MERLPGGAGFQPASDSCRRDILTLALGRLTAPATSMKEDGIGQHIAIARARPRAGSPRSQESGSTGALLPVK